MYKFMVLLLVCLTSNQCDSARILGVVPFPSYSHQIPFQSIWKELSLRGHQVTTIVTNGVNDPSLTNLTEIVIKESYGLMKRYNMLDAQANGGFLNMIYVARDFLSNLYEAQLSHPDVKKLLDDSNAEFDLVIFEALASPLPYSWRFNCPSVGVASMDSTIFYHYYLGNPTHPLVTPDWSTEIKDTSDMKLADRVVSSLTNIMLLMVGELWFNPVIEDIYHKHFGPNVPSLVDLTTNVDMLLVTTNPIFHDVRALNPHTVTIGSGLHITPPKPLPEDVKAFLDGAKEGVVYFSLGSNVKGNLMLEDTKKAIYKAFSELPYKFLIKVDWVNLTVPENVKVGRWLPQQDILRHPNIKLFITQGGLQSLQEAVTNAVPLVSIPFFGDQQMNTQKIVKRGFAVKLERTNITTESMKWAIQEVITNPKYKLKAIEMQDLMYDEPMTSLERAVWWIEYVIRHKGAPHFKSNAAKLPLYQYFLLDVIGVVLVSLIVVNYILYKIIQLTIRVAFRLVKGKLLKKKKESSWHCQNSPEMKTFQISCVLLTLAQYSLCAKVLFVAPIASYSHQIYYRRIWLKLAERGHDLTVMTTDVMDNAPNNVEQIDWGFAYKIRQEEFDSSKIWLRCGVNILCALSDMSKMYFKTLDEELSHPKVQQLLKNETEHFDLVIIEQHCNHFAALARRFNCPLIGVSSGGVINTNHEMLGNPAHPSQYPDVFLTFYGQLSYIERIISSINWLVMKFLALNDDGVYRKHFGSDMPHFRDLIQDMDLLLINTHPVLDSRPLVPWTIRIGGLTHIGSPKPLPTDIESFLDSGTKGVVYISFGTNVKVSHIEPSFLDVLLDTFKSLPYKVLWKLDSVPKNVSNNVMVVKWLPQQDVLRHKNIKLFITQGGLQSFDESVYNHVPMIVIPFVSDQKMNAKMINSLELGIHVDKKTATARILREAIERVITDQKYKKNVEQLAIYLQDQPMSGLDTAIWWIEYVIRHKGAKHLRLTQTSLPLYQYLCLDIAFAFLCISTLTILLVYTLYRFIKCILSTFFKFIFRTVKSKTD
ncbi:uncharacterized protein LOC109607683 [Aethina tumida]|uniref:uncharacterized protein LOC109607683 n=1 Tax=Aethina tumida TaxID=116153 RepID=UPI0021487BBE|nr:uncharacterized protein LOC109607683 [Aethina tumida]